jgi:gamma-glutamylcyclotransferase (GGCT)/AIG2-like uncharacterized protein YtfP
MPSTVQGALLNPRGDPGILRHRLDWIVRHLWAAVARPRTDERPGSTREPVSGRLTSRTEAGNAEIMTIGTHPMQHRVLVYGTLLSGEANHHLLADALYLGSHRTARCFSMFLIGTYPGAVRGGLTALSGEVYGLDSGGLSRLDRLEDYPRLYDRQTLASPYGRAWIYLYRGPVQGRDLIPSGDWRAFAADPRSPRLTSGRRHPDPRTRGPLRSASNRSDTIEPFAPEPAQRAGPGHSHP